VRPDLAPGLVCPTCLGELTLTHRDLTCARCLEIVGEHCEGITDFIRQPSALGRGVGPRLMHSRLLAQVYQRYWRPLFIAVASGSRHDLTQEYNFIDDALRPAQDEAPGTVVDLSCGPGHGALHLHRSGAFERVIGVDWSQAMLNELRANLRAQSIDDLPLIRADVARLPFASGSLAGIHAGAALHLWPDPAAAAAEICRVLRPGGGFIASTFAHQKNPISRGLEALVSIANTRVFYEEELLGLFRRHGLGGLQWYRRGSLILFWGRRQ